MPKKENPRAGKHSGISTRLLKSYHNRPAASDVAARNGRCIRISDSLGYAMKTTEKLAIITALKKQVAAVEKETREEMKELLAESPDVDRMNLMVGGRKVGTVSRKTTKADFAIVDDPVFEQFALMNGFGHAEHTIKPEYMPMAIKLMAEQMPESVVETISVDADWKDYVTASGEYVVFAPTGELVPGVDVIPERVTDDFMVRGCKWDSVAPALGEAGLSTFLLEGGE